MTDKSHVHKLRKHTYKKTGQEVFFCTLPDCHFKLEAALALGKRSLCSLCNAEFIMNEYQVKLVRPHCNDCSKIKVTGIDGKKHYVRKVNTNVLANIAEDNVDDLRSRLGRVTVMDAEEDI